MSITIGSTTFNVPIAGLVEQGHARTTEAVGGPRLGTAELSNINHPALQHLLNSGQPTIDGTTGDGKVPPDLGKKLEAMSERADIYAVMALFQQISQEARNSARLERRMELETRVQELGQAAQKMRDAAVKRLIGGLISGAIQFTTGLIQIGTNAASAAKNAAAAKQAMMAAKFKEGATIAGSHNLDNMQKSFGNSAAFHQNMADKLSRSADTLKLAGEGSHSILGSTGTVINSIMEFSAQLDDAEKADAEKRAALAQAKYDQANETMQHMREIINDIQSKLAAIEQSAHDTRKQITRA